MYVQAAGRGGSPGASVRYGWRAHTLSVYLSGVSGPSHPCGRQIENCATTGTARGRGWGALPRRTSCAVFFEGGTSVLIVACSLNAACAVFETVRLAA